MNMNPDFMKIWNQRIQNSVLFRQNWFGISYALLILAALTPKNHEIELIDENVERIDFDKEYDLVGITSVTGQIDRAYEIADLFRNKGRLVIMGGIHVTVLPEEAKPHADSVVIGEAEYLWQQILVDAEKKQLKPFYRSDKPVKMKDVPIPRYDLINNRNYSSIFIQATRGCPHDCEFCLASNVYGRKYRSKSVEQVLAEIHYIHKSLGKKKLSFSDDNILVKKKFFTELFEKIIPMQLRYYVSSDVSIADDAAFLQLLKRSGCVNIYIGFETVYEEGLKNIDAHGWKLRQFKKYRSAIERIQSLGMGVLGAFIIGLDSDDPSIFEKVGDFIIGNHLNESQITILTPLPGSRLYHRLEKEGRLLPLQWSNYSMANLTFVHPNMSKEAIENGFLNLYQRVYSEESYRDKIQYFKNIQKRLIQERPL
jgi:radical SAM superfamily enzyme YgiQ (UPF0313 family)